MITGILGGRYRKWVPRKNRRQEEAATGLDEERVRRGFQQVHSAADGEWSVRAVAGGPKTYRCPGCDQEISPGVGHVVAWPSDGRGDLADRRHWHTGCWNARDRRFPTSRR